MVSFFENSPVNADLLEIPAHGGKADPTHPASLLPGGFMLKVGGFVRYLAYLRYLPSMFWGEFNFWCFCQDLVWAATDEAKSQSLHNLSQCFVTLPATG